MGKVVDARSGDVNIKAELDFERERWTPIGPLPPEGDFPLVAHLDGKRYQLYSDETFNEVEPDPDEVLEE